MDSTFWQDCEAAAATWDVPALAVGTLVEGRHDRRAFGCTVETRFRIASITKPFTAMLALELLDPQAKTGVWPADVRVRHLLSHTSGYDCEAPAGDQARFGSGDDALAAQIAANADLMEAYAVLAFHKAASSLPDGAPGEDEKINPYAVSLDSDRWEADGLFNGEGLTLVEARETPAAGMENLFMEAIATPA